MDSRTIFNAETQSEAGGTQRDVSIFVGGTLHFLRASAFNPKMSPVH
jgi:hypothetical protein